MKIYASLKNAPPAQHTDWPLYSDKLLDAVKLWGFDGVVVEPHGVVSGDNWEDDLDKIASDYADVTVCWSLLANKPDQVALLNQDLTQHRQGAGVTQWRR